MKKEQTKNSGNWNLLLIVLGIFFLFTIVSAYPNQITDRLLNISTGNLSIGDSDLFVNNDLGRVGIGTTSPTHELSVGGNGDIGVVGSGGYYLGDFIKIARHVSDLGPTIRQEKSGTSLTMSLFRTDGATGGNEIFYLRGEGVSDTGNSYDSGGISNVQISNADGAETSQLRIKVADGSGGVVERMRLNHLGVLVIGSNLGSTQNTPGSLHAKGNGIFDGNVGIGTTAPTDELTIIGDVNVSGCYQLTDGTIVGGSCASGREYKENIKDLEEDWDKFNSVKPKTFNFKTDKIVINKTRTYEREITEDVETQKTRQLTNETTGELYNETYIEVETIVTGIELITENYNETIYLDSKGYGFIFEDVEIAYPDRVTIEDGIKKVTYGFEWILDNRAKIQNLKAENNAMEIKMKAMEESLCRLGETQWC